MYESFLLCQYSCITSIPEEYCLLGCDAMQSDSKEAANSCKKVVNFWQITWHHTPQTAFFIVTTKRTLNLTPLIKVKKSLYMSGQALMVEAPTFQDNRHMRMVRLSVQNTGCLYP